MRDMNAFAQVALHFLSGPQAGETISITKLIVTLGRDTENDVVIHDPERGVSRKHARLYLTNTGWLIENVTQNNILLVDEQIVQNALLSSGSIVKIGQKNIIFRFLVVKADDIQRLKPPPQPEGGHLPVRQEDQTHIISPPGPATPIPDTPDVPLHAVSAIQMQQALDGLWEKQQLVLTQMRSEIESRVQQERQRFDTVIAVLPEKLKDIDASLTEVQKRLTNLETKTEAESKPPSSSATRKGTKGEIIVVVPPSSRQKIVIALLFIIAGSLLFYILSGIPKLVHSLDSTDALGNILVLIGGLYLGYELLGKQQGIMLWLTHFASSVIVGIIPFELLALLLLRTQGGPIPALYALKIVVLGALLSGFSGIWLGFPVEEEQHLTIPVLVTSVGTAILFWLLSIFCIVFPLPPGQPGHSIDPTGIIIGFTVLAVVLGGVSGVIIAAIRVYTGVFNKSVNMLKVSKQETLLFSGKGAIGGALIGFCVYAFGFYIIFTGGGVGSVLAFTLIFAIMGAVISILPGSLARYTFWFIYHLPDNWIGMAGLLLTFSGGLLLVMHPLINVFSGR